MLYPVPGELHFPQHLPRSSNRVSEDLLAVWNVGDFSSDHECNHCNCAWYSISFILTLYLNFFLILFWNSRCKQIVLKSVLLPSWGAPVADQWRTVRGPICPFFRADSRFPYNQAPGPNCTGPNLPFFGGGQLGPGQLGPGAQLSGAQFAENHFSITI